MTTTLALDSFRLEVEGILRQLIADVLVGELNGRPHASDAVAERIARLGEDAFGRTL